MELDFENNRFANGDPTMPLEAKNGRVSLCCDSDENVPSTLVNIAMDFFTGKMQLFFRNGINTDSDKLLTEIDYNHDYYNYIRYGKMTGDAMLLVLLDGPVVICRVPVEYDERSISVFPETFSSKVKLFGWVDFRADIDSDILQKICNSNSIDIVITTDSRRIIHYHTKELISYARLFYRGLFDSSAYHDEITEKAIKKEKAKIEEAERNKNTYKQSLANQRNADKANDKSHNKAIIVAVILIVLVIILIFCSL